MPTHYFRIVAMVNADQDVETFGVIVPNATDGEIEINDYLVSIEEIEKKSGLIFFPLLDPQVADRIKAEVRSPW